MSDAKVNITVLLVVCGANGVNCLFSVFGETNSKGKRGGQLFIFRIRGDEKIRKSE